MLRVAHSCVYVTLCLYLETRQMSIFLYLHCVGAMIALSTAAFIHRGKCQEVIKSNVSFVNGFKTVYKEILYVGNISVNSI